MNGAGGQPAERSEGVPIDLTVIIVSFNTRDMTLACLRSVREQTRGISFEVIIAENASTDGSADAIAAEFPAYRLMRLEKNIGFAAGNNAAARVARGEFLLLLNPDTLVLDGAIQKLLAFARARPEARIWGGRTLWGDRTLNPTSCWARATPWSVLCQGLGLSALFRRWPLFNPESMPGWKRDSERAVDIVTGCFFMIERSFWNELGGFDPAFFMYAEEADMCLRARRLGARPRITPDATIVHFGGASEKVRAAKMVRLFRAKAQLMAKHWSAWAAAWGRCSLDLWALTRMIATGLLGIARPRFRESYKTWREVWARRPEWRVREALPPDPRPAPGVAA
jgi:GT2 family glycosyltransferase